MLILSLSDEVNPGTGYLQWQVSVHGHHDEYIPAPCWQMSCKFAVESHTPLEVSSYLPAERRKTGQPVRIWNPSPVNLPTHSKYWLKNNDCFPTISAVFPALPFLISSHRVILSGLSLNIQYILKCAVSCMVLESCSESFQMSLRPHSQ